MLGVAEMWYRKGQFLIIAVIVALVAYLALMMGGLGAALLDPGAIGRFNADLLVFSQGSRLGFGESELSGETVAAVTASPAVASVAPVGYFTNRVVGAASASAFVGVEPGSVAEPPATEGRPLRAGERGAVLADKSLLDLLDLGVGDRITLPNRLTTAEFEIVGATDQGAFSLQPVLYGSLDDWRLLRYGAVSGDNLPAASFLLVSGAGNMDELRATLTSAVAGVEAGTSDEVFNAIGGISGIRNTIRAVVAFGLGVGALVIGAFFYVLTVQKVGQIGVLKALGASSWFVSRQLLAQVGLVVIAGLAIALTAGLLTADLLLLIDLPVKFVPTTVILTSVLLAAFALLAAAISAKRITGVDPLIALGQQQ